MSRRVVRLTGGLGNQLFQLAKAYDLEGTSAEPVSLDVGWFRRPSVTLEPRPFELGELDLGVPTVQLPRWAWHPALRGASTDETDPFPARMIGRLAGVRLYEGWWQEWALVQRVRSRVQAVFNDARRRHHVDPLPARSMAVHIRLGDYANDSATRDFHGLTDYRRQLVQAAGEARHHGSRQIVIFSDSPESMTSLPDVGLSISVSSAQSAWEALLQMATADCLMLSNSTLSWWAGILGDWELGEERHSVWMPTPWFRNASLRDQHLRAPSWALYPRSVR